MIVWKDLVDLSQYHFLLHKHNKVVQSNLLYCLDRNVNNIYYSLKINIK